MNRKDKFLNFIAKHKEELRRLGIISIGIFGSVARGEDIETSDYDIIVKIKEDKKTFKTFTRLCDLLDREFNDSYEIVTLESLSPYIKPYILKDVKNVQITS